MEGTEQKRRAALAYCIVAAALAGVPLWLPIPSLLGRLVPDDGFYYLKIAQNLVRTGRQSFDGIHWTNGYHPLWGWVLAGLVFVFRGLDNETLFRTAVSFNAFLLTWAGWIFAETVRRLFSRGWVVVPPLFFALFFFAYIYLMETALLLVFTGYCLRWMIREKLPSDYVSWCVPGLLLAGLGLARLDSVFLGIGIALAILIRANQQFGRKGALPRISTMILTAAVHLAAWLIWTRITSGHWTTISGALKLNLSRPHPNWLRMKDLLGPLGVGSLACGLPLLILAATAWRRDTSPSNRSLISVVLVIACYAHVLFHTFFVTWGGFTWAVAQYRLIPILLAACIIDPLFRRRSQWLPTMFAWSGFTSVAIMYTYLLYFDYARPQTWTYEAYKAARWIRRSLPPGAVIGMKDSGVLGYFAERPVVNLDGLVSDWNWQSAMRDERHLEFLERSGVNYLAQHNVEARCLPLPYRFWFKSMYYDHESQPIFIPRENIVYRGEAFMHGGEPCHFVIWKFRASDYQLLPRQPKFDWSKTANVFIRPVDAL